MFFFPPRNIATSFTLSAHVLEIAPWYIAGHCWLCWPRVLTVCPSGSRGPPADLPRRTQHGGQHRAHLRPAAHLLVRPEEPARSQARLRHAVCIYPLGQGPRTSNASFLLNIRTFLCRHCPVKDTYLKNSFISRALKKNAFSLKLQNKPKTMWWNTLSTTDRSSLHITIS